MRMTSSDPHGELIARLVADAAPVRRLWSPAARLVAWAVLLGGMLIAIAASAGWPFGAVTRAPWLAWELACALAAAVLWAGLALGAAVPGREASRRARLGAAVLAALPIAFWLGGPASEAELPLRVFIERGIPCAVLTLALALLPSLALLWAVGRGAPLAPRRAGAWAGAAGFLTGYLLMRIFCPLNDPAHLLIWHVGPVALGIGACAALGSWWLARWRRWRPTRSV